MEWLLGWSGLEAGDGWVQSFTDVLGWGTLGALLFLVPLVVVFSRATRRRHFWCAQERREVEVEFEEQGLPGFRHTQNVRSCSVFDPPTAVRCHRDCLNPDTRLLVPPARQLT